MEYFDHFEELDAESKYLVHKSKDASINAYAPYSKFCVGAALILDDGSIITGSNQENASFPLCMCAERAALYAAAATHPGKTIMKMAITAHKKNHKDLSFATACGACRQVMLEYEFRQNKPMEVIMYGAEGKWIKAPSAASLLPLSFSKDAFVT